MHSRRIHTARLLTVSSSIGESAQPPWMQTLWMQTPIGIRHPGGTPPGHVTFDACWEANPPCE